MKHLLNPSTFSEPMVWLGVLVTSFCFFFGKSVAQALGKKVVSSWPAIWKMVRTTAHEWLNIPSRMITKDVSYYKWMLFYARIQWGCMKLGSFNFVLMFLGAVAYAAFILAFGEPAPTLPIALVLGMVIPGFCFRVSRTECAHLKFRIKELQKKLAEALEREGRE